MAIPIRAKPFPEEGAMDPSDRLRFFAVISKGQEIDDILDDDEVVKAFHLEAGPEAVLAGLTLLDEDERFAYLADVEVEIEANKVTLPCIVFWVLIADDKIASTLFNGGVDMPVEMTLDTNMLQRKQHTIVINGVNK